MLELYLTLGYWSFPSKFHKPIFYCLCHHIYICNLWNQFFKQIKLISVPSNAHEDLLLGGNVSLFVVTSRAPSNKVHCLGFTIGQSFHLFRSLCHRGLQAGWVDCSPAAEGGEMWWLHGLGSRQKCVGSMVGAVGLTWSYSDQEASCLSSFSWFRMLG